VDLYKNITGKMSLFHQHVVNYTLKMDVTVVHDVLLCNNVLLVLYKLYTLA